jgi:hypothetical protein
LGADEKIPGTKGRNFGNRNRIKNKIRNFAGEFVIRIIYSYSGITADGQHAAII